MPYLHPILGLVLLLFGRTLYWVFVAFAGFLLGLHLAEVLVVSASEEGRIVVGLVAGGLGAVLAMAAQRIAFAAGGFFAGGYLMSLVLQSVTLAGPTLLWLLAGGVVGALVAAAIMDWAIVLLSSLVGAGAIVQAFPLDPLLGTLAFVALALLGVSFQGRSLRRRRVED